MGRGGSRNQQMGGGGYQSWEGGPQMGFRGPRNYGGNNGGMNYNNWVRTGGRSRRIGGSSGRFFQGNGNFRDNNMDDRPFKRRKQNDWLYQY
jgi:hypothetical protein